MEFLIIAIQYFFNFFFCLFYYKIVICLNDILVIQRNILILNSLYNLYFNILNFGNKIYSKEKVEQTIKKNSNFSFILSQFL